MYNLGLTGSAQRQAARSEYKEQITHVQKSVILSTVAITELWVCSEKKINLGHKIVCLWEKNLNKEKLLRGKDQYSHPRIK